MLEEMKEFPSCCWFLPGLRGYRLAKLWDAGAGNLREGGGRGRRERGGHKLRKVRWYVRWENGEAERRPWLKGAQAGVGGEAECSLTSARLRLAGWQAEAEAEEGRKYPPCSQRGQKATLPALAAPESGLPGGLLAPFHTQAGRQTRTHAGRYLCPRVGG